MQLEIDLSFEIEDHEFNNSEEKVRSFITEVLNSELCDSVKPYYISVAFVDNKTIQEINKNYREKDAPTDVISFAYHETEDFDIGPYDTLGDIIISIDKVEEQAKDYDHSFERELYFVLTHGILHLLGYDHIEEDDRKEMRAKEEEILNKFGYTRGE